MFNPCIIIPVYNHHEKIQGIIEDLAAQSLHCFLLDDGSDEPCKKALLNLASLPNVSYKRSDTNRGKGAAVCDGLHLAFHAGYTHALQIDADGQHDTREIPSMLAKANTHSEHVISASRAYEDMPKGRRNGRKITDIWVNINTLSFQIKDSMCGFRVYPLSATIKVIEAHKIKTRMDFDTDILVKLYWHGLNVTHVPIQVTYDKNITSHFDVIFDNIRISLMHASLFFGMLTKIPQLIKRQKG